MAECGLLNFVSCLPEKFFEYLISILNAPLQPLLSLTKDLLSASVEVQLFVSLWAIIVYILSMFYGFLIIYSGFMFIISGYDVQKREKAKTWLRNIIIMIILVQSSFFLYELAIELSSVMTSTTLSLINPSFFLLTADNLANIGLQLIFFLSYIFALLLTVLILIIRYAVVAIGVVLLPLSIFFYFIQPLKSYGILLLNFVGIAIFVTFFDGILLIGFSKLVEITLFTNIKILVMIASFLLIDIMMLFLMFFSVVKAAIQLGGKYATLIAKFV